VPAVDRLEREKLVVRGKDPHDRRRTPLVLTDEAHRALKRIPTSHPDDLVVGAVRQMDIEQVLQLRTLLHTLLMGMSADKGMIEDILANHPERKCMPR
jgi:DNA-binding MarR family transcriptional regulator